MKRLILAAFALTLMAPTAGCDKKKDLDPAEAEAKFQRELEEAAARVRNNKLEDAGKIYSRLIEERPEDGAVLAGIGTLEFQQGKLDLAETHLKAAIGKAGDDPATHFTLGEVLSHSKRYEEAAGAYAKAFELDAENSDFGIATGYALVKAGKYAEAQPVLEQVAELDPQVLTPENVGVYTLLGDALRGQDKLDPALKTYMKAQTTYSSDKMARAGAAFVYEAKDDIPHALSEWSAYIQRDCCSDYSRTVAQKKIMELKAAPEGEPEGDAAG